MGQYQQWLYAQEMDRRLQAEVESLETELLYLKDRVAVLEQTLPETENVILRALLIYQRDQANRELQGRARADSGGSGQFPRWSNLPNMETPQPSASSAAPYYFGQHSRQGLQPEEMLALFERREQVALPGEPRSLDVETQVQNENIRRWFERWHREIVGAAQPEGRRDER